MKQSSLLDGFTRDVLGWTVRLCVRPDCEPPTGYGEYTQRPEVPYYIRGTRCIVTQDRVGRPIAHNDKCKRVSMTEATDGVDRVGRNEYKYIHRFVSQAKIKHMIEDAKRLEACGEEWFCVELVVEVSRHGTVLGWDSICGIESDMSHDAVRAQVADLIHNAVDNARKK